MSSQEYRVFDFREIAALDDAAVSFRNWISKASSFFSDFWADVSDYGAQLSLGQITTESYTQLIQSVSKENLCCIVEIEGHFSSICYTSYADLRLITSEMLCLPVDKEASESRPLDVELSTIELSLAQLFIDHLVIALGEGWMGAENLVLKTNELSKDPGKVRIFRARDLVTKTSIQVAMRNGSASLNWLLPNQMTNDLLETTIDRRAAVAKPRSPTPQLVGQVPVELVSVLGKAHIPMSQLSNLQVGQLILLDQRIDHPVIAYVNEDAVFECWPGRLGRQQALEVTHCLKS